jgi:hypothetical protein
MKSIDDVNYQREYDFSMQQRREHETRSKNYFSNSNYMSMNESRMTILDKDSSSNLKKGRVIFSRMINETSNSPPKAGTGNDTNHFGHTGDNSNDFDTSVGVYNSQSENMLELKLRNIQKKIE